MISPSARLTIQTIPLECLQVKEYQSRYVERLLHYVRLLEAYPDDYAGLLHVVASDTHPGMFCILDGHTRFCASLLTGRKEALCVVVDDPGEKLANERKEPNATLT